MLVPFSVPCIILVIEFEFIFLEDELDKIADVLRWYPPSSSGV